MSVTLPGPNGRPESAAPAAVLRLASLPKFGGVALLLMGVTATPAPADTPLAKLDVRLPTDWSAAYSEDSKSWTYEKETPRVKGELNLLRLSELPGDPGPVDAYAKKLQQKDVVDPGYIFSEITQRRKLPDGFMITGDVASHKDPKEKTRLGLVMVRKVGDKWLTLTSTSLRKEALRQEAVELFQSAKLK